MRPVKIMQSYRLPEQLVERIDRIAEKMDKAKVDVVQEALENYLDKAERQLKPKEQP